MKAQALKLINLLSYKDIDIPRPHVFADLPLKSTVSPVELTDITLKINELLPQLSDFISQFHSIILTNNINDLLQKGLEIEGKLKKENVNYTSQILDKVNEFNRLNASYKH